MNYWDEWSITGKIVCQWKRLPICGMLHVWYMTCGILYMPELVTTILFPPTSFANITTIRSMIQKLGIDQWCILTNTWGSKEYNILLVREIFLLKKTDVWNDCFDCSYMVVCKTDFYTISCLLSSSKCNEQNYFCKLHISVLSTTQNHFF